MLELIKEEGEEGAMNGGAGAKGGAGVGEGGGIGGTQGDARKQAEESERLERLRLESQLEEPKTLEFVNDLGSVTAMDL